MNKLLFSKITILLVAVLSFSFSAKAEKLSPTAVFSLITVSPGEDLYSCFGHSALLLQDTANNIFKMYNYGTFDFDDPNFYWNFTRGKLKYKLDVEDPRELIFVAKMENRYVTQQLLNFSLTQTQRLYDFLENNFLPENRFYKYDFFYDNCSTRIRDALKEACGDSLNYNLKVPKEPQSFRAAIDVYLVDKRYQDFGMDLGLGLPADDLVSPAQYMFLPNNLMDVFAHATNTVDGKVEKLVSSQEIILPNTPVVKEDSIFYKPWFVFSIVLLLVSIVTFYQYKSDKNGFWLDGILFSLVGLFGLVLLFLWFVTDHGVTARNLNLLWALPFHLVALPMLLMKKKLRRVSSYFLINFFAIMYLLIFWKYIPQELNSNCIPILLMLALRSMYIYYRIDKNIVRWNS